MTFVSVTSKTNAHKMNADYFLRWQDLKVCLSCILNISERHLALLSVLLL